MRDFRLGRPRRELPAAPPRRRFSVLQLRFFAVAGGVLGGAGQDTRIFYLGCSARVTMRLTIRFGVGLGVRGTACKHNPLPAHA
jgi:hypothetical protein